MKRLPGAGFGLQKGHGRPPDHICHLGAPVEAVLHIGEAASVVLAEPEGMIGATEKAFHIAEHDVEPEEWFGLGAGGERPETPASAVLEPDEWKALLVRIDVTWDPGPEDEPKLHRAMHLIVGLGGYQDRKREPGPQTFWRGLHRIEDMAQVFGNPQAMTRNDTRPP